MSTDPKPKTCAAATATKALYSEYSTMLRGYARQLVSSSTGLDARVYNADDIVQAVFEKAHIHYMNGHSVDSPKGFLYTAARNVAFTMFSRSRNRVEIDAASDMDVYEGDAHRNSPEHRAMMAQQLVILKDIVNKLPEKYRTPFMQARVWGNSSEEIAKFLGITKGTARNRVSHACKLVRVICDEHGIDLDKLTLR